VRHIGPAHARVPAQDQKVLLRVPRLVVDEARQQPQVVLAGILRVHHDLPLVGAGPELSDPAAEVG